MKESGSIETKYYLVSRYIWKAILRYCYDRFASRTSSLNCSNNISWLRLGNSIAVRFTMCLILLFAMYIYKDIWYI